MEVGQHIEDKLKLLFKNFNDFVLSEVSDKNKKICQRVDTIKNRKSAMHNEYRLCFANPEDSESFNYLDILNSVHNEITQGYSDFIKMIFRKFRNTEPPGEETTIAFSEKLELLCYLEYDNILNEISFCTLTNDKFDDLFQIKYILTGDKNYDWMPYLYDDFQVKLQEKFPYILTEINSFNKSKLEKSIYQVMMEIDKENSYVKSKQYLNIDSFLQRVKSNALTNPRWEFYQDKEYKITKCLTNTDADIPEEIQSDVELIEKNGFTLAQEFEKTDFMYQTVNLIITEFLTYEKLNQNDLELLFKRVNVEVLSKTTMTDEEKLEVLLNLIRIIKNSNSKLIKPETVQTISILGEVLAIKGTLACDEIRMIFEKRLNEAEVDLRAVLIADIFETLNPQAFSCVVGIANHLQLLNKTYSQYLSYFL